MDIASQIRQWKESVDFGHERISQITVTEMAVQDDPNRVVYRMHPSTHRLIKSYKKSPAVIKMKVSEPLGLLPGKTSTIMLIHPDIWNEFKVKMETRQDNLMMNAFFGVPVLENGTVIH